MKQHIDCNTIVEGKNDPLNRLVTKVYYSDKEYAIYDVANSKALCYLTENVKNDISEISCEIDEVLQNLPGEKIQQYKYRFAKAYRECFEGKIDNAKSLLSSIIESFTKEKENLLCFKYSYIIIACIILIINIIFSVYILGFNLKLTGTIKDLYYIASFGSMGGLISVTVQDFKVKFITKAYFYIFDAIFRIMVSMASSIAVYYVIKGNVLLGFINNMNYSTEVIFLFAIIAGFSERFVPKLFGIVEEKAIAK